MTWGGIPNYEHIKAVKTISGLKVEIKFTVAMQGVHKNEWRANASG